MEPDGDAQASVEELVFERLSTAALSARAADLVVAALLGEDELADTLNADGQTRSKPAPVRVAESARPGGVYLRAIVVQGFRGIGAQSALRLQPGPGLTVIAGRNGSGKSSFAEAAELVLTGDNKRWSGRTVVWRAGWRNLHAPDPSRICVEMAVDGEPGVAKVTREWAPGADLDGAPSFVQRHGRPREPVTALGWSKPLELYRPFL